jgi:hypothetical protein
MIMRIFEIILDQVSNTALFEMAFKKREVRDKFVNQSYQIAEHLVKILAYDDPQNYNHWCAKINAFLKPLWALRWGGKKLLSKEEIMKCLWKSFLENGEYDIQGIIKSLDMIDGYAAPRNIRTTSQINSTLINIYTKLSDLLSRGKRTPIQTILQELGVNL